MAGKEIAILFDMLRATGSQTFGHLQYPSLDASPPLPSSSLHAALTWPWDGLGLKGGDGIKVREKRSQRNQNLPFFYRDSEHSKCPCTCLLILAHLLVSWDVGDLSLVSNLIPMLSQIHGHLYFSSSYPDVDVIDGFEISPCLMDLTMIDWQFDQKTRTIFPASKFINFINRRIPDRRHPPHPSSNLARPPTGFPPQSDRLQALLDLVSSLFPPIPLASGSSFKPFRHSRMLPKLKCLPQVHYHT